MVGFVAAFVIREESVSHFVAGDSVIAGAKVNQINIFRANNPIIAGSTIEAKF